MTTDASALSIPLIPNTLDGSPVKEVLSRLYAAATETDAASQAEEQAVAAANGGVIDEQTLAAINDQTFMAVAPEVGRLIYLLVRSRRPLLVVEFGTSFGLSAIHIAAALRDNGRGRLITTERSASKVAGAAQHLAQAGLSEWVEIRQGDAFETLTDVKGIDVVLLDGWKQLYLPLLKQLEPALSRNCLVIADDVISLADRLAYYLAYVRAADTGFLSCEIPLHDGLELSIR
jgi:predicted O-methyltransferase YrrM